LFDTNAHTRGVYVGELQVAQLGDPQPRAVGDHENDAMLRVGGQLDQPRDLFARQNVRQLLRRARTRDVELSSGTLERGVVEKPQSADRDVAAAPGKLALLDQVQQVALYFGLYDLIGLRR